MGNSVGLLEGMFEGNLLGPPVGPLVEEVVGKLLGEVLGPGEGFALCNKLVLIMGESVAKTPGLLDGPKLAAGDSIGFATTTTTSPLLTSNVPISSSSSFKTLSSETAAVGVTDGVLEGDEVGEPD